MASWSSLPRELHSKIFEILVRDSTFNHEQDIDSGRFSATKAGLSDFSLVCKQWQPVFEKEIYRRLIIDQTCLPKFERIATPRRTYLTYLCLEISLTVTHGSSGIEFGQQAGDSGHEIVKDAIGKLFQILSTWSSPQPADSGFLVLEISARSISDSRQVFIADPNFDTSDAVNKELMNPRSHSTRKGVGSIDECQAGCSKPPDSGLANQLALSPRLDQGQWFPDVKGVKKLVMRRQTRQHITDDLMHEVLKSLSNLQSVDCKPWRKFLCFLQDECSTSRRCQDIILQYILDESKVLTIFEDVHKDFSTVYCTGFIPTHYPRPENVAGIQHSIAGAVLAQRSLSLEKLYVSYFLAAEVFFAECQLDWVWEKLTSLSFTSEIMVPSTTRSKIDELLVSAGKVAFRMPRLQRTEIWNRSARDACVFRYQATGSVTIEWRGTWNHNWGPEVVDTWQKVAKRAKKALFIVKSRLLDEKVVTTLFATIRELKLSGGILSSVSLEQTERGSI